MATESGFNPVPLLVHVLAIALGLYLGWVVMGALSPDLPDDSAGAGVGSSSAPRVVAGGDRAPALADSIR